MIIKETFRDISKLVIIRYNSPKWAAPILRMMGLPTTRIIMVQFDTTSLPCIGDVEYGK